ncbi:MAG TPA: hypothetical protein PJ994_02965 [Tepidiformaceae bacterium]|nr:hypothetical protein [Tepidiformaceae bacterium]
MTRETRRLRATLVVVIVATVLLAGACAGETDPPAQPLISSAVSERDVVNGEARSTSSVTVRFDRPFEWAPSRVPLESYFEFEVPQAQGGTSRALVNSAELSETNAREVVLRANRLIPEGSTLKISRRAFDREATGDITATVSGDLSPLAVLLATTPLAPVNATVFDPPVIAEIDPADWDPDVVRRQLEIHLNQRQVDPETYQDALAFYDAIPAEVVPSPKLRAALAALVGTFAEPAIGDLLTDDNCTGAPVALIEFQDIPGDLDLIARVTTIGSGQRVISVNPYAAGERFEHLMPILAHEAIHCDQRESRTEELVAAAFDTFLYLQLVAYDPQLAQARTRVARELNIGAIAMINSGARLPESVGILPSPGAQQALPGTNAPYTSYAEMILAAYPQVTGLSAPVEPLAQTYVDILAYVADMAPGSPNDVRYIDELLGRSMPLPMLLAVIQAFELAPAT